MFVWRKLHIISTLHVSGNDEWPITVYRPQENTSTDLLLHKSTDKVVLFARDVWIIL